MALIDRDLDETLTTAEEEHDFLLRLIGGNFGPFSDDGTIPTDNTQPLLASTDGGQECQVTYSDGSVYRILVEKIDQKGESAAEETDTAEPWCDCGAKTTQGKYHRPGCPARVKADAS
jgi:hypothetical protein